MNTGTCFLPSWTAIVWPTISGKIVDARDQVRSIFLLFSAFSASMRASRRSCTHGPFLLERLIVDHSLPRARRASRSRKIWSPPTPAWRAVHASDRGRRSGAAMRVRGGSSLLALPTSSAAHDVLVGALVLLTRAIPQRRHAPRRDRVPAGCRRALAASVRVVDRVHRGAARLRAHAHVALAPGLADLHVLMLGVADRPNRGPALGAHKSHLAGGQPQGRHLAVAGHQLHRGARRARHLTAATRLQLDVVHDRADGHTSQ